MFLSRLGDIVPPRVRGETRPGIFGQIKISCRTVETLARIVDLFLIVAATTASGIIYQHLLLDHHAIGQACLGMGIVTGFSYVFAASARGLYSFPALLGPHPHFSRIPIVWASVAFLVTAFLFFLKDNLDFSPWPLAAALLPQIVLLLIARWVFAQATRGLLAAGRIDGRRVVTIGEPSELLGLSARFLMQRFGLKEICRVAVATKDGRQSCEALTNLNRALAVAREQGAEEFLIALRWGNEELLETVRTRLRASPLTARLLPDRHIRAVLGQHALSTSSPVSPVRVQRAALTAFEKAVKRAFDILVSMTTILVLWPFLAMAAIAVKLDSKGPVIFRQRRTGFNGREFVIFKFRTMTVLEDGAAITQACRGDHRVTRLGKFLRRSSIDELPQLFNVLKGNMSLVGPRPHAVAHDNEYKDIIAEYGFRHHVKPGLTGWAQVNGLRGETRSVQLMAERVKLDLWYINNWSFGLDINILFRTCFEIMRDRAY